MEPRSAIWRESSGLTLQKIQKFTFMLAQLGGGSFDPSLLDHLRDHVYAPVDEHGKPLAAINESIHASVIQRYGKAALACADDATGDSRQEDWRPKNLTPFFDDKGALKPGIPGSA